MARTLASALPALLAALAVGSARAAPDDDNVRRYLLTAAGLYEGLDYERALQEIGRARKFSRGPSDDALIALYEGIVLADMGKSEEAQAAFRTALLLEPDSKLPIRVSPKLVRVFEDCRGQVKGALASGRLGSGIPTKPPPAPPPLIAAAQPAPPPPEPASDEWRWIPLGAGTAFLGGAAAFALVSKSDRDTLLNSGGPPLTSTQWTNTASQGRDFQTAAIVGAALGGACLGVGALLWLTKADAKEPVSIRLGAGPSGAWVQGVWR